MKLLRSDGAFLEVEFSRRELVAFQAGLRSTLESLEEWDFQTRTGTRPDEMQSILNDLSALLEAGTKESSDE